MERSVYFLLTMCRRKGRVDCERVWTQKSRNCDSRDSIESTNMRVRNSPQHMRQE